MIKKSVATKSKQSDVIITPGILPKKLNRIMVLGGGFGASFTAPGEILLLCPDRENKN